ncbi:ATP-grasp domain-containing protein [Candidatus Comchoanobacter bicostacola]|uniref:ATP-grasp domain-containing protein n=1 Tax=Candidatus Comchoanobacter bicostacola TaxID=2919598 RepID=A0ABY5DMD6_9GAMM|nr:ATP-grasp domain-containing protein [Candidatus Comchoanobacter bicostacola]UTC24992.1 ATP-grasp domain-containing protein [Candidatus Comchoanobacter bicostacola]
MHTYFYHNSKPYYQEHSDINSNARAKVKDFTLTALCLSKTQDIVQISPGKKSDYEWLKQHYKACGLSVSQNIFYADQQQTLPNGFELSNYSKKNDSFAAAYFDNKKNFLQFAKKHGVEHPNTTYYDCVTQIKCIDRPVMLKTNTSSAGSGNYYVQSLACLKSIPTHTPLHVQELIEDIQSSLSLQYEITSQGYTFIGATTMFINEDFSWAGCCPARIDKHTLTQYNHLVKGLYKQGLRGPLSLDLLQRDSGKFAVLECNPRFGGSTYPCMLAHRLNITQWVYRKFRVKTLKQIESVNKSHNIFYSPKTQKGIIVVHWETKKQDLDCNILIAGNHSEQREIIDILHKHQIRLL